MDEDSEKRAIEDLTRLINQVSMPTSGVTVVRSRCVPSASRANVPLLVTAHVNLDD
jgi:hypothetical protein